MDEKEEGELDEDNEKVADAKNESFLLAAQQSTQDVHHIQGIHSTAAHTKLRDIKHVLAARHSALSRKGKRDYNELEHS